MKERMVETRKFLEKKEKITMLDLILALLVAFFAGVLIGILTSPRSRRLKYFGCFNGSFNGNSDGTGTEDEECFCGECCKECCEECEEERCCGEKEYCGGESRCCEEEEEKE